MSKSSRRSQPGEYLRAWMVITLVWLCYMLLMPVNRTENDDGYHYAWLLVHGNAAELFQSRYPLFLPFEKLVLNLLHLINFQPDPYLMMACISSLFTAGALFFAYLIFRRRFMLGSRIALLSMLLLAFSYGFWRYAVEAELYGISHFLVFLTLYVLSSGENRPRYRHVLLAGVIGTLAVLIYKPNFIPLFLAFPLLLILQKQWRHVLVYLGTGAAGIFAGYALIFSKAAVTEPSLFTYLMAGGDGNGGNPFLSVFVYLSNIASSNFLYGFARLTSFIHMRFPANMIVEEILTASFYPVLNCIAIITSICLVLISAYLLFRRFQIRRFIPPVKGPEMALRITMWAWLVLYWLILSFLDPNSPEPWMMLVPPLFFIAGVSIFAPARRVVTVYLLLFVLVIHNLAAAVIPNLNKDSDYNRNQSEALLAHARKGDLIVCFGSYTEFYYLQYYTPATVINASENISGLDGVLKKTARNRATIFLCADVMHPDRVMKFRSPANLKLLETITRSHKVVQPVSASPHADYYTLLY